MKRLVMITGLVLCALGGTLMIGCSKREQTMAGTSVVSGAAAATSFLKGHFKRGTARKRKMKFNRSFDCYTGK